MTERLSVDDEGLNAAAHHSADIAGSLAVTAAGTDSGSQPSHAGVSAIDAALASARDRQGVRVSNHAQYMKLGSGVYRHTDEGAAAAVVRTI
ncbi:hypothetical protein FPV58_30910 [Mycolicibacterium porcinum]|uniref:hypothetical protein n=1 Tax=Mycolicibacterium porcinum TaxID=39693 RepID=UPI0011927593|nr:hypothetical protein [Mycolicibacterium porcinum]TVX91311.1 hypothetical protein FPV58_30910 [Mycolicibacterium porcinum]